MFKTALGGKAGSVVVDYNANESLFTALVIVTNVAGKLETKQLQDTDLLLLYKAIKHELGSDKMAALALKKFTRAMASEIRVLMQMRRAFIVGSKADFARVRAASKAAAEKRRAADKKAGKEPKGFPGKKGAKKVVGKKLKKVAPEAAAE